MSCDGDARRVISMMHVHAVVQVQYATGSAKYRGPLDCLRKVCHA